MTERTHPQEQVAELVAEARGFAEGSASARASLMRDMEQQADEIEAERDRLREAIEEGATYIDSHWLAPFRPGETADDIRRILSNALTENGENP